MTSSRGEFESFGLRYRLFRTDARVTVEQVERLREDGTTALALSGAATGGRGKDRLDFLSDLPGVRSLELWDIGSATIPIDVLGRLEILKLAGRCGTTVSPAAMPKLRFFAGDVERVGAGSFGGELRGLSVDHWSGNEVRHLPFGSGIEFLRAECRGQTVSLRGINAPCLTVLELHNVEIESLDGVEGAPRLGTLSLQPPGVGPSALREIDLRPLANHQDLQWLRIGRQGKLTHLEALAKMSQVRQLHGYRSFIPPEYLGLDWVDPLPDSKSVQNLLHEGPQGSK